MLLFYFDFLKGSWDSRVLGLNALLFWSLYKKNPDLSIYFWNLSASVVPENLRSLSCIYHHWTPLREENTVITILEIRCQSTIAQVSQAALTEQRIDPVSPNPRVTQGEKEREEQSQEHPFSASTTGGVTTCFLHPLARGGDMGKRFSGVDVLETT